MLQGLSIRLSVGALVMCYDIKSVLFELLARSIGTCWELSKELEWQVGNYIVRMRFIQDWCEEGAVLSGILAVAF